MGAYAVQDTLFGFSFTQFSPEILILDKPFEHLLSISNLAYVRRASITKSKVLYSFLI